MRLFDRNVTRCHRFGLLGSLKRGIGCLSEMPGKVVEALSFKKGAKNEC